MEIYRSGLEFNAIVALTGQIRRMFLSESIGYYLAISMREQLGDISPYANALRALILRDGSGETLGRILFAARFVGTGGEDAGYLPPTFLGEMYAANGLVSFLVLPALGVLAQSMYICAVRARYKSIPLVVFVAVSTAYFGRAAVLGLVPFLTNLVYFLLVGGFIWVCARATIFAVRGRRFLGATPRSRVLYP
jgi:hypothetical protein